MLVKMKVFFLIFHLPFILTVPISLYENARFNPIDIHFMLANYSLIETLDSLYLSMYGEFNVYYDVL